MAFTEFYINAIGNNLNGGSSNGNYTFFCNSGNWQGGGISNFRIADGQNPNGNVNVGDFASIYPSNTGLTAGVYIARISAVQAAVNGNISVNTTIFYGTAPTNSATNRAIRVAGAWSGPSGAVTFPFGLAGTIG